MESESSITNKTSDSGYSNSFSNSQGSSPSQTSRSAGSNSRHGSSNSSRSSGYFGATNQDGSSSVDIGLPPPRRYKDKEHKKKKLKATTILSAPTVESASLPIVTMAIIPVAEAEPQSQNTFLAPVEDSDLQIFLDGEKANVPLATQPSLPSLHSAIEPEPPVEVEKQMMDVTEPTATEPINELSAVAAEALPLDQGNQIAAFSKDFQIEKILENERKEEETIPKESKHETSLNHELGFCCVISMYDGLVLYTTPSLTTVLGFPKDTWLGRSFIDFVHPKDRETFSNQVTTGIALPLAEGQAKRKEADFKTCLYVCMRKYRAVKASAPGVLDKAAISYQAFHLTVTIKHVSATPFDSFLPENNAGKFLVVEAVPLQSSYKVPRERKQSPTFGMRHNTTCILDHVDSDVVTNFGFLPQDMLGKSVFDFYHPEDMPFLKEVYKSARDLKKPNRTLQPTNSEISQMACENYPGCNFIHKSWIGHILWVVPN